jgi:protein-disulfide isomerase
MNSTNLALAIAGAAGLGLVVAVAGDVTRGTPAAPAPAAEASGADDRFALDDMTDMERQMFRAEIRDYLLENPEVIMEAVRILEDRQTEERAKADSELIAENAEAIFDDGHSWVGGNPDGDLTLVEFMDYRCGYCRRAAPEVESLVAGDGDIRFVLKEFPILGEQSMIASRFAIATKQVAGEDAYKAVHDALIAYKGEINETALTRMADTLGLEAGPILDSMDSDAVSEVIAKNHSLAKTLGISGTPSFVMGDRLLRGYVPREAMEEMAAEIRAEG